MGNFSQLFTNLITHKLTNLKTHHLVNLKTHELNNSPPNNLKRLQYILQNTCRPSLYSSEKKTPEISKFTLFSALPDSFSVRFLAYYLHFAPFCLPILVANSYFSTPKYPLFIPKILLFNDYFALSGHVFHGSKRGCLYNCCECLCFSPCVWQHFTLHLAPFYLAFSTKTHCI